MQIAEIHSHLAVKFALNKLLCRSISLSEADAWESSASFLLEFDLPGWSPVLPKGCTCPDHHPREPGSLSGNCSLLGTVFCVPTFELCSLEFFSVTVSGKQDINLLLLRDSVHGTLYGWYSLSVGFCRPAYFWWKSLIDSLCSQRCNSNLVTSLHSFLLCLIQFI